MTQQNEPHVALRAVSKSYQLGPRTLRVLPSIDLVIRRGEFLAIMGPSGSGKSTLLNLLGLLDRFDSGVYQLAGMDVSKLSDAERAAVRNRELGFVFQQFNLLSRASALDNVMLPLVYAGVARQDREARARTALARLGLADREAHRPTELSGGQQQRVALARAMVNNPDLLIADEPTGSLDQQTGAEIMACLHELHGDGHSVVLVTHDAALAAKADRIVQLCDGVIEQDSADAPA